MAGLWRFESRASLSHGPSLDSGIVHCSDSPALRRPSEVHAKSDSARIPWPRERRTAFPDFAPSTYLQRDALKNINRLPAASVSQRCDASSSMPTSPRELCRPRLFSVFPNVGDNGDAIQDSDDKTLHLFWGQVLCDEMPVNAQTQCCLVTAKSFDLNHDPGPHVHPPLRYHDWSAQPLSCANICRAVPSLGCTQTSFRRKDLLCVLLTVSVESRKAEYFLQTGLLSIRNYVIANYPRPRYRASVTERLFRTPALCSGRVL
jgi:hypothetical protein